MKKNLFRLFAAGVIAASAVSCSVNEIEEGIKGSFPYLEVELTTKNITKVADSDAIAIQTNRKVSVTVVQSGNPWLTANVADDQMDLILEGLKVRIINI